MDNFESGNNPMDRKEQPLTKEDLQTTDLSEMSRIILNGKINLYNDEHKDFIKKFLNQVKSKNNKSELEKDDIRSVFTNEGAAVRKIVRLINEEKQNIKEKTKDDLITLKDFLENENNSNNMNSSGRHIQALYEGTKYNKLDINSAINSLKDGLLGDKMNPEFVDFMKKLSKYFYYILSHNSISGDDGEENLDDEIKRFKENSKFYLFGASKGNGEIVDLARFMMDQLGDDFFAITKGKEISKTKRNDLRSLYKVDVLNSEKVGDFNISNLNSLLGYISDFGGVDQGAKPDGFLRGKNSKTYSGFFSRLFTSGEWSQSKIVGELQIYNKLKERVSSVGELKDLIAEVVYPGNQNGKAKVDSIFSSGNNDKVKDLLKKFQQISLGKISQTRDLESVTLNNQEQYNEVERNAKEDLKSIEKVKEKLTSSKEYKEKFKELIGLGATSTDAKKILDNWTYTVLSSPEIYAGINLLLIKTITVNKVVDDLGKTLSESKTEKKVLRGHPYLLIGLNLASIKNRFGEGGKYTIDSGISANGAVGLDGLALPLSVGGKAGVTLKDDNLGVQDGELKGNWKIIGGVSVGKDILKDGKIVTMASIDLNWNSKIDAIEAQIFKNKKLLSNLIDQNGQLKENGIEDIKKAIVEMKKILGDGATNEQKLYLEVLETNLIHLSNALKRAINDKKLKNIILSTWLKSIVSDFDVNVKSANSGMNLSGLHIGYIFGLNLLSLGINIEHIQGSYRRSSFEQRSKDYDRQRGRLKNLSVDLSDKLTISSDKKEVVINSGVEVVVSDDSKGTISIEKNYETGETILKSNKEIYISSKKEHNSDIYNTFKIVASNNVSGDIKGIEGQVSEKDVNMKLITEQFNGLGLNLPSDFGKRLYLGVRGKIKGFQAKNLFSYIDRFLKDPTDNNLSFLKSKFVQYPVLFGFRTSSGTKNKEIITNMNLENMKILATNMQKLTWGDNKVRSQSNKDLITFGKKDLKLFESVSKAESNLFAKEGLKQASIDNLLGAKNLAFTDIESGNGNFERRRLSDLLGDGKTSAISIVAATPKNGSHGLSIVPGVDVQLYGDYAKVTDNNAKVFILSKVSSYIDENLIKLNNNFKNNDIIKDLVITKNEYIEMILTGKTPYGVQVKLDQIKSKNGLQNLTLAIKPSEFISFNAGFEGNECFNAGLSLLLGKISLSYNREGKSVTEVTNDIGNPDTSMDNYTVGLSIMNTNEVVNREEVKTIPENSPEPDTVPPEPNTVPPEPNTVPPKPNTVPPEPNTVPPEPNTVPPEPNTVPPEPNTVPPEPNTVPPEPNTDNGVSTTPINSGPDTEIGSQEDE
ncbi:MAG: hypothetical protein PHN31_03980 [Candidatus Gracilibacteria bacterium]|nr:hypothetical protein [Candidatus Gracilibacteria bacterium]